MPKNFSAAVSGMLAGGGGGISRISPIKDPKQGLRIVLGTLLAANLVAGWMVWRPVGGSPEELRAEVSAARKQLAERRILLKGTREIGAKASVAKSEGDRFLDNYFLARRTTYSTVEAELNASSGASGITLRDHAYNAEPIEGSDDLSMLTVTANFEGTYDQLIHMVNLLDRSKLLLIIDSLQATPQQGSPKLLINMKLNAFVREGDSGKPVAGGGAADFVPTAGPLQSAPATPAVPAPAPKPAPAPVRTALPGTGPGSPAALPSALPSLPGPRIPRRTEAR